MVINDHQLEGVQLRLYTAIVIPTAMYACETSKRTAMIDHRLDVFHRAYPRHIMARPCHTRRGDEESRRGAVRRKPGHTSKPGGENTKTAHASGETTSLSSYWCVVMTN